MPPVLAYWAIRGLAQPIRLLLKYTQTEFEDKRYVVGPGFDKSCWFDVKYSLGLDFPNLPYYVDGDVKLTQSNAILRYIAGKHNLIGTNEKEKIRVDLMENEIGDFRDGWVRLCYSPNFDELKGDYISGLPSKLSEFSKYLGDNNWLAGENISFVDFIFYEMLDQHMILVPDCLDSFLNLKLYCERFRSLDSIKTYISSNEFITRPLNNPHAGFK
ncbi:glutathione S-transferase Mu 3-like [Daphnia pulicaria]|uniref:glutathione S-transferase Mu 3-like n=1 Tax=Daphnia pulicaria TaxID=35523 RepID=UPI001EECCDFC|nr:glutathione S-transferase Mu 3-like [Daphnia pulicaria]